MSDDRPKTKSTFIKNVRNYFREYCTCTSIHGFRYFGEKRTIFERVWWFVVFVMCLTACVVSIYAVYKKWERSPVIVSFATRGTPIYNIPFPAITICPESKSMQTMFNYTDILHKKEDHVPLSPQESTFFEYMSLICKYRHDLDYGNNRTFTEYFFEVIDSIKPKFEIQNCRYMGRHSNCREDFVPLITEEGICYTFNMLDRDEIFRENVIHYSNYHKLSYKSSNWSIEYGYSEDSGIKAYPKRALLAGAKNAFSFNIVTQKQDLDYTCRDAQQGYKVLLHTAIRMPNPRQQYFILPLDQAVVGAVQPVMITTSESVKLYNPKRRQCYFPSERHLKYFKIYSSLNCQMECLTNYTLHMCSCVNFYMPRENGTKICGTGSVDCMVFAEAAMQSNDLYWKIYESHEHHQNANKSLHKRKRGKADCDCLPICADLTYDIETSQTDWDWVKQRHGLRASENITTLTAHKSTLTLFFKSNNFITSQRNELYGPTDFLANFGGLLGLFTGFSVLSLMEILYFLTVRMCCNSRLYGYWSGPQS